jgi:integrase
VLAHPQLRQILDAVPEAERIGTIVKGIQGRPYSEEGFRTMWGRFVRDLQDRELVGPGLTFHGLRHTVGKALAESWAGANDRTIGAAIGDKTGAMGRHYSEEANLQGNVDEAYARAEQKMSVDLGIRRSKLGKTPRRQASGKVE